uniref:Uncharacterized protein n=1 Tax=Arundo donax TaxID=35708 RepID=A0A0A8ZLN8_ARUDO
MLAEGSHLHSPNAKHECSASAIPVLLRTACQHLPCRNFETSPNYPTVVNNPAPHRSEEEPDTPASLLAPCELVDHVQFQTPEYEKHSPALAAVPQSSTLQTWRTHQHQNTTPRGKSKLYLSPFGWTDPHPQ